MLAYKKLVLLIKRIVTDTSSSSVKFVNLQKRSRLVEFHCFRNLLLYL